MKMLISAPCLFLVALLSCLFTMNSYADQEVTTFKPVFKLRSDLRCWPSHTNNGANSGDCRGKNAFLADQPPMYWEEHTETSNGVTARLITYWVYLSHQSACAISVGEHVDDWEKITVHLENGKLKHVAYNQHNGRYVLDAASVPLEGTHPIVYTGKYSHGSYHDQRSRCAADDGCFVTFNYCFYWKDPRGPGVSWSPSLQPLSALSTAAIFPGSPNPHQRSTRPHREKVCREDGGNDIVAGIGLANTCNRNPAYLKDENMTLEDMVEESIGTVTKLAFKTHHNTYLTAIGDGGGDLASSANAVYSWEQFEMAKVSGSECVKHNDTVYIATGNGIHYLRGNFNGVLDTLTGSVGSRARFTILNYTSQDTCLAHGDVIALKNTGVNKFVVAEPDGTADVDRTAVGTWEKFIVELQ